MFVDGHLSRHVIAEKKYTIEELLAIMQHLRSGQGCPWDREQTIESLRTFLLEECYEVLEAIEEGDPRKHCQELGDLLFQIVFQSQLAKEEQRFEFADVVDSITKKIIRRHPHVFGSTKVKNAADVAIHWEQIKQQEKAETGQTATSVLDGLPVSLPALLMAHRLSERASRVGFDWKHAEEVFPKVLEEIAELKEAMEQPASAERRKALAWELGDVFFALSSLARHLGFCGEDLVRLANQRFGARFRIVESLAAKKNLELQTASIEILESLWQEAKSNLEK